MVTEIDVTLFAGNTAQIRNVLRTSGDHVSFLNLNKNADIEFFNNIFEKICEALKGNPVIKTLDLSLTYIEDAEVIALAEVLKVNTVLHTLDLGYNDIGYDGVRALAEALKVNTVLHTLDLGYNDIGYDGVRALAEALKVNRCITTLNLYQNYIKDVGVIAIVEALKVNTVLHTLYFSSNNIENKGAKALAEALKVSTILHTLDLGYNDIGYDGVRALAEALKHNRVLHTINLRVNWIGDAGATALSEALEKNTIITSLNLYGNKIGEFEARRIYNLITRNQELLRVSTTKLLHKEKLSNYEFKTLIAHLDQENSLYNKEQLYCALAKQLEPHIKLPSDPIHEFLGYLAPDDLHALVWTIKLPTQVVIEAPLSPTGESIYEDPRSPTAQPSEVPRSPTAQPSEVPLPIIGQSKVTLLITSESIEDHRSPTTDQSIHAGIATGRVIASPFIHYLNDQVNDQNQDKSLIDYYAGQFTLTNTVKSAVFSATFYALPNYFSIANKVLIAKMISDIPVNEFQISVEYATSMLLQLKNSFVSFAIVSVATKSTVYQDHPFATGILVSTAGDLMKLSYDAAHVCYDLIMGKDASTAIEGDL